MTASTALDFRGVLDTLGYTDSELVSIIYWDADGKEHTAVGPIAEAVAAVLTLPDTVNVCFGVNPTGGPARAGKGRGKEADATRLAALVCDLDFKPGGCKNRDEALAIIAEIGIILGTRASIIVDSGHGLHAYWPISDGHITGRDIAAARALLRRFGRLVAHVAASHNVHVDNVFDLARVMRLPGSFNNKSSGNGEAPILVTAQRDPGGPLAMAEADERLTEHGIEERDDDRADAATEISSPDGWTFGDKTCAYVTKMIDAWPTDRPKLGGGRNPFVYDRHIRLLGARRLGCITETDYERARQILADLLTELVSTITPRRKVRKFELAEMNKHGTIKVASKTDEQTHDELGDHHRDDAWMQPKPQPAQPTSLADALAVFKTWLHLADTAPVIAVAATIVANLAEGEAVWFLLVGPPSGGKTEILTGCMELGYIVPASTITEAALLSGTAKRDRAKTATGGLMRQIGDFGILLTKDFTSVLSQNMDTAKQAMSALREVFDGRWDRPIGAEGARILHWEGKCGFIGGVTPSYDRYGSVINALGDRYLLLRMPDVDAPQQAKAALRAAHREKQMRAALSAAMRGLIASADLTRVQSALTEKEEDRLSSLAIYTATARTCVERNSYTGELLVIPQPEGPARLVKAMRQLHGAMLALGVDHDTRWNVLTRMAVDCAPAIRTPLLLALLAKPTAWQKTSEIAEAADMATKTAYRHLDDLALLGMAEHRKAPKAQTGGSANTANSGPENAPHEWKASTWLRDHWPHRP